MKTFNRIFLICTLLLTVTITYADEHEGPCLGTACQEIHVQRISKLTPQMTYWSLYAPSIDFLDFIEYTESGAIWDDLSETEDHDLVLITLLNWTGIYSVRDIDNTRALCRFLVYVSDESSCYM